MFMWRYNSFFFVLVGVWFDWLRRKRHVDDRRMGRGSDNFLQRHHKGKRFCGKKTGDKGKDKDTKNGKRQTNKETTNQSNKDPPTNETSNNRPKICRFKIIEVERTPSNIRSRKIVSQKTTLLRRRFNVEATFFDFYQPRLYQNNKIGFYLGNAFTKGAIEMYCYPPPSS